MEQGTTCRGRETSNDWPAAPAADRPAGSDWFKVFKLVTACDERPLSTGGPHNVAKFICYRVPSVY